MENSSEIKLPSISSLGIPQLVTSHELMAFDVQATQTPISLMGEREGDQGATSAKLNKEELKNISF